MLLQIRSDLAFHHKDQRTVSRHQHKIAPAFILDENFKFWMAVDVSQICAKKWRRNSSSCFKQNAMAATAKRSVWR